MSRNTLSSLHKNRIPVVPSIDDTHQSKVEVGPSNAFFHVFGNDNVQEVHPSRNILDDDGHTLEVLKDLGLCPNGPGEESLAQKGYKCWKAARGILDHEESSTSGPTFPPGFESNSFVGPTKEERVKEPVSNSLQQQNGDEETMPPFEIEKEQVSVCEWEEAIKTWNVGKSLGMTTPKEGDVIQAIIEERMEWKDGKKGRKSGRKNKKKKTVAVTGELSVPK